MRGSLLGRAASAVALFALLGAAPAVAPAPLVEPAPGGEAWTPASLARLRADLDAEFAAAPALRGAHAGFLALDSETGTVLYARNADDEFQPASTLKLLIGSVALERLGPQYRFRTQLTLLGPASTPGSRLTPGSGPTLGPAATLVGGGDPLLTSDDLDAAAAALAGAGVRSLSALAVDDGRYEAAPYPEGWTWDDFAYYYAAPVSALTIDENVLHLAFGVAAGSVVPLAGSAAAADSLLACGGAPAPAAGDAARAGAAGSEDSLDTLTVAPDCAALTGSLPAGGTTSLDVAVRNPGTAAFDRLAQALRAHAIALPAGSAPVVTHAGTPGPGTTVLWSHDSAPYASWLGPRFWVPSDNLFAELLLRELAYAAGARPGTTAAGLALERTWLASLGVDPATTTLADGCGMSQYDRITPRDLVAILQHDWNGPNRSLVLDSLPVGGARGTIEGFAGTPAAGRTFAKTGSMMHVRGLAGFLATRRHGAVTFAFNVDDWVGDYPALAAFRAHVLSRIVED